MTRYIPVFPPIVPNLNHEDNSHEEEIEKKLLCGYCKCEIDDEKAKFCQYCGAKIKDIDIITSYEKKSKLNYDWRIKKFREKRNRKKRKDMIFMIITLILLIVIMILGILIIPDPIVISP